MAVLTPTDFVTKWTPRFAYNNTGEVAEDDFQEFTQDIADSAPTWATAGKSAYQVAVDNGYVGTEPQWLTSLAGNSGLSAYQIWLSLGNSGTETDFINALKGTTGLSAYQVWLSLGNTGTETDFINSLKGATGKSSYQIWLDLGNVGTETDFINALKSTEPGPDGKSAYQVWLNAGNTGTVTDYLNSLKGTTGKDNYQLWLDAGNTGTYADYLLTLKGTKGDRGDNAAMWVMVGPLSNADANADGIPDALPDGGPPEYVYRIQNAGTSVWHLWAYEIGSAKWVDEGPLSNTIVEQNNTFTTIPANYNDNGNPEFTSQHQFNLWVLDNAFTK